MMVIPDWYTLRISMAKRCRAAWVFFYSFVTFSNTFRWSAGRGFLRSSTNTLLFVIDADEILARFQFIQVILQQVVTLEHITGSDADTIFCSRWWCLIFNILHILSASLWCGRAEILLLFIFILYMLQLHIYQRTLVVILARSGAGIILVLILLYT